jgi:hypothetical protein
VNQFIAIFPQLANNAAVLTTKNGRYHMKGHIWALGVVLPLAACVTPAPTVADPTRITVSDAIIQIRDGLVAADQKSAESGQFAGLYACSATVVFNVTAGANNSRQLVLDAAIKPPVPAAPNLGLTGTSGSASTSSVGNQITINLVSSLCSPGAGASKPGVPGTPPLPPPMANPPAMLR